MPKTMICAHRGLDDSAPENTLAAFVAALEREMAIEFDIQVTADQKLVVVHDGTVDRTTDGSGQISQLSLADVKALDAGSWFGPQFAGEGVPTFDEVLELVSRYRHVSPSIALDVKALPPDIIDMIRLVDVVKREVSGGAVGGDKRRLRRYLARGIGTATW